MSFTFAHQTYARRTYLFAAVYGFIVLVPQYFLEASLVPPATHPEQFYGFVGLALVWQIVFVMISRDVQRYRMLIPVTVLEKLAFGLPALILYLLGRVSVPVLAVGLIDLALGVLFAIAFLRTRHDTAW